MTEYKIVFTDEAKNEIENIFRYIALILFNEGAANYVIGEIKTKISTLKIFPKAYPRMIIESDMPLRMFTAASFNVYYKVYDDEQTVVIMAVIYGKRDQKAELIKRFNLNKEFDSEEKKA